MFNAPRAAEPERRAHDEERPRRPAHGTAAPSPIVDNPFPGPQPYRASDRSRFFGRDEMARRLGASLLAQRCTTLFGPSGAGKSSLMQAAVIPWLEEAHDLRTVRVDSWPAGMTALDRLADALYDDLRLGARPPELPAREALIQAVQRAARRSERPLLVYLDQLEQLLFSTRPPDELDDFIDAVDGLAAMPIRALKLVLSLREDYLGRFRDRARDRRRLLDHGFRVGPLTVGELVDAVCKAAHSGDPPQSWSAEEMRSLLLQVRIPGQLASDEAEAQAVYAQIVCRALWIERASPRERAKESAAAEAEPILKRYLETTLNDLGPLQDDARRLLEDHLIAADGSRTLRTEKELRGSLAPEALGAVLKALESAAILRAQEHQGSRYFEIGHDWLARKVHDAKLAREREKERLAREEQQRREQARQLRMQRRLRWLSVSAVVVALSTGGLGVWAVREKELVAYARDEAARARDEAARSRAEKVREAERANRLLLLSSARELSMMSQSDYAAKVLLKLAASEQTGDWMELALYILSRSAASTTLRGHLGPATSVAFSPDNQRLLTASDDGTARIWHVHGRGDPVVLEGHRDGLTAAAWSPGGGARILTASSDGTARIWSADGSGSPRVFTEPDGAITVAAWSPDGARFLTASHRGTVKVWSAGEAGEPIVLAGHGGRVTAAAWSPDGARIVSGADDGTARVFRADGAGAPVVLAGHEGRVTVAAWSPDGARIVLATDSGAPRVYRADGAGAPVVLAGHEGRVTAAAWSPDGTHLATGADDHTVLVYRADPGGGRLRRAAVLQGHAGAVSSLAWSADGSRIVTASHDNTARIFQIDAPQEPVVLRGHQGRVKAVAISSDGDRVATTSWDRTVRVWHSDGTGDLVVLRGHLHDVRAVAWSPDGTRLVTGSSDRTARIWSADGGRAASVLQHPAEVEAVAWSPEGERVATACGDGAARIWRVDGAGAPILLRGHRGAVRSVAWSPDGRRVVTASEDEVARIWSADGAGAPSALRGHTGALRSAAWSPDGKRIVTASEDRTARIFRADGQGEPVVLEGHGGAVAAAAWSPDGKRIVTASHDETARVWNADGSGEPFVYKEHTDWVLSARWSPDGRQIITTAHDNTARVWRPGEASQTLVLRGHDNTVYAAAWSADGKRLATAADDATVRTWNLDPGVLRGYLEDDNTVCLPPEVRQHSLNEPLAKAMQSYEECERSYGRTPFHQGR